MAVERRSSGICFFGYAGKRGSGTTIRLWYGRGATAEWLAKLDAQNRTERRQRAAQEQHERQELRAAARLGQRAIAAAKQIMSSELGKLGYVQHDRGVWRKARSTRMQRKATKLGSCEIEWTTNAGSLAFSEPYERRDSAASWKESEHAALSVWLDMLIRGSAAAAQVLQAEITQIRDGLLDQGDSELEQVCVDRVVLNVLEVEAVSLCILLNREISQPHAAFLRARQRAAARRLNTAVKALQTVRRLLRREAERTAQINGRTRSSKLHGK